MDCSKWSSKVKKTGLSRPLYLYFLSFLYHAIDRLTDKLFPGCGIRTEDLWCGKWLLCQLSHIHCQFKSKVHSSHYLLQPFGHSAMGKKGRYFQWTDLPFNPLLTAGCAHWSLINQPVHHNLTKGTDFSQMLAEQVKNDVCFWSISRLSFTNIFIITSVDNYTLTYFLGCLEMWLKSLMHKTSRPEKESHTRLRLQWQFHRQGSF